MTLDESFTKPRLKSIVTQPAIVFRSILTRLPGEVRSGNNFISDKHVSATLAGDALSANSQTSIA